MAVVPMLIKLTLTLCHLFMLQDKVLSESEIVDTLKAYESKYFGREAKCKFEVDLSTAQAKETYFISKDGNANAVETTYTTRFRVPGGGKEQDVSIDQCRYDNGSFFFYTSEQNGQLTFLAAVGNVRGAIGTSDFANFFGYSGLDFKRLSELLESAGTQKTVSARNQFGKSVSVLTADVQSVGRYEIFVTNATGNERRVIGFSVSKSVGDIVNIRECDYVLGKAKKAEMPEHIYKMVAAGTSYEIEVGQIVYDEAGYPVELMRRLGTKSNPTEYHSGKLMVLEHRPLSKSLSSDKIFFGNIKTPIPKRSRVDFIRNNGLPYELRDGRLVALVDGTAVDISQKIGYRPPASNRIFWYGIPILLFVVVGWMWWKSSKK